MQTSLCIVSFLMFGLLLAVVFRAAVKRGGRQVKFIDPQALIIFPEPEASIERNKNRNRFFKTHNSPKFERFFPLDGAYNFRDLGGYLTQDSHYVRWGQLYRSDEFSELTDQDLENLEHLKLQTIIDLRSPYEIQGKENRLPPNCTYQKIRIYQHEPLFDYLPIALFKRHLLAQALGANYIKLIERRAEAFGAALRILADPANFPVVYHCSAGKDRTGIVCALALSVLGVPDQTIIADYSLSNLGFDHFFTEFAAGGQLDGWGIPYEEFQAVFIVNPDWMRNLLHHLRKEYGGAAGYLVQRAGLQPDELERIRENLLVSQNSP
jgi:protein-tyrosine phosphatase